MNTQLTSEDITHDILKILDPVMEQTILYRGLELFVTDCDYDPETIKKNLTTLEFYYTQYQEAETRQESLEIIREAVDYGLKQYHFGRFFIEYADELEVMTLQTQKENKELMNDLYCEIYNPVGVVNALAQYITIITTPQSTENVQ